MDIKKVTLTNFLSHKNTSFSLPKGLTGLIGLNGSGKSSLIKDSVTWALWGKARGSGAGDDLIHKNKDYCEVRVEFSVNNTEYFVTRSRSKGKKTLLCFSEFRGGGGIDLTRPVLKTTQEDINTVLGMDYDIFRNSCCIEQGCADSFSKLTPKEAANLILSILQLNNYTKYKTAATDRYTETRMQCERASAAREYLVGQCKEIGNVQKEIKRIQKEIDVYKEQYEKSEQTRKELEKEIEVFQKECNAVALELNSLNREYETIECELKKLSDKVDILDKVNGACPLCKTYLNAKTKESVKQELLTEYQDLLDKKTNVELKLNKLKADYGPTVSQNHISKTKTMRDYQTRTKNAYSQMLELQGELKALKNPSSEYDKVHDKLKENGTLISQLEKDQRVYSELTTAFGHKGIPLLIVDNTIRELEVLINDNLKLLCDLPISLRLITQKESSSGDLLDTFQILIQDGVDNRSYFNYSGGERMLIDLAIRLGLSELLARRNNFKVETLIIDEGLGSLDETNQINLVNTLKMITTKFKRVILITHTEAKDYLDTYVETVKTDGISRIKLHKSALNVV